MAQYPVAKQIPLSYPGTSEPALTDRIVDWQRLRGVADLENTNDSGVLAKHAPFPRERFQLSLINERA